MLGPSGDVPIWRGFKDLNTSLSLFFNSQEKVFHLVISQAWPTLIHTYHPSSIQLQSDGGHMSRLQVRKSDILLTGAAQSLSGLLSEGKLPFAYTSTKMFIRSDRSAWVNDYCPSTNDTLPESQQDSYRTGWSEWQSSVSSACLCQHQLKAGILNPIRSLSTNNITQHTAQ